MAEVETSEVTRAERAYASAPNLDLLRAVAVLLVVWTHVTVFFKGPPANIRALGLAAVYLFFVHTSLVLMLSLSRHVATHPRRWALAFYVRRAFRIYPLSMVLVAIVIAFAIPVLTFRDGHLLGTPITTTTVLSSLTLTSNLTHSFPMMGVLWSLCLEVQMYLFLPIAWLVARRWGWPAVLGLFVLACVAAGLTRPGDIVIRDIRADQLTWFVPNFLPGVLAFTMLARRPTLPSWLWLPFVGALVFGFVSVSKDYTGWAMCLALGVALPSFEQVKNPLVIRIGALVARYSYGIYLCHIVLIWLSFTTVHAPLAAQIALFGTLLVVVPVIAYHVIEAPLVRLGARVADRLGRA